MPDQRGQQAELGRGQRDRLAAHADLARAELDQQAAVVVDLGPRLAGPRPPQQGLDPGGQFAIAERLGEIVIGAAVQPPHLLALVAVRGQDEDGDVAQVADALENRPPVQRRQPDVEHDQVGPGEVKGAQPLLPVGRARHVEAVPGQHGADAQ